MHLYDDDVCSYLPCNASDLVRGATHRGLQDDPCSRSLHDRVGKLLQLLLSELGLGTRIEDAGVRRLRRPQKGIGDDVNQVKLRIVDGAYQVARSRHEVFADVAQINADDDHHAFRRLMLRLFAHGTLRLEKLTVVENTHRPCPRTESPNIRGWVSRTTHVEAQLRHVGATPLAGVLYGLVTQRFAIEPRKGAVLPVDSHGSLLETGGS